MPWVDLSEDDPAGVDLFVRSAIHKCWHSLPADKKDLDEVERHIRRLVARAFRDFREDAEFFMRGVSAFDQDDIYPDEPN